MKNFHTVSTFWRVTKQSSWIVIVMLLLIGCGRADQLESAASQSAKAPIIAPEAATRTSAYPLPPNAAGAVAPGTTAETLPYPLPPTNVPPPPPEDEILYASGELGIIVNIKTNVIADIKPDSPAQQAGVQIGDVLTLFEGKTYDGNIKDAKTIMSTKLNKPVTIEIQRGSKKQTLSMIARVIISPTPLEGQPTPTYILDPFTYL